MPLADSRQRILETLKRIGPASVTELSLALGLTAVTVRHHLSGLQSAGLVGEPARRPHPGPGRPEMAYTLTDQASDRLPRNLDELCTCLLRTLARQLPRPQAERLLREAGRNLAAEYALPEPAGAEERLGHVRLLFEARGYFPVLAREADRIRMTFGHCPYFEIVREVPSLCQFDLALLEGLFGSSVQVISRIADHQPSCVLVMQSATAVVSG